MSVELTFDPDFPRQYEASTRRLIQQLAPFFLHNVRRLVVGVCATDNPDRVGDVVEAQIGVMVRYRSGRLQVSSEFFRAVRIQRERILAHELSHAVTQPMADVMEAMLLQLPEAARKTAEAWWLEAHEAVTEDVAEVVMRVRGC